tara:strand:+ start:75 stop:497 length:423 start_codon:yes stop_codon:yes gene_type:complete
MNQYSEKFNSYAVPDDTITAEIDGFTLTARIENDQDSTIDDDDSHNVDQSVTGCNDDQQTKLLAARKAWRLDQWYYCGIVISASYKGVPIWDHCASLWAIECNYPDSDNSHLTEVANELIAEAIDQANGALELMREAICT